MSTSNEDPGRTSGTPPVGPSTGPGPGYPPPGSYGPPAAAPGGWPGYGPAKASNGMGTAAMVLGILAVLSAVILIGGVLGIVAIVLGAIGVGKVRAGQATNRGMAVSGIVLGVVALAITAFVVFLIVDNADEIDNLADCLEDADNEVEADRCADQFEDEIGN